MDSWITDTRISPRFQYYTRANADEVGPDPFSPLGWSLGWMKGCIPGVAAGFGSGDDRLEHLLESPRVVRGLCAHRRGSCLAFRVGYAARTLTGQELGVPEHAVTTPPEPR